MSYGDFEESCPRCGKKTCGDAGNVCLSPDERRWITMRKALEAEVQRLKDQGQTACDLFDELKKSQAQVRKLEEEKAKLLDVVKALQFACNQGAATDFLKNVSQANNLANKYMESVKTNPRIVPLPSPMRDKWNAEHDVVIGPCACGAWHETPNDYLEKIDQCHAHLVNPPCTSPTCSYCVARSWKKPNDS